MRDSNGKSVLILGANGRLGLAGVHAFAADGWRVVAQVRPGTSVAPLAGVTWLHAAPGDTPALLEAARGASVVVHGLNPAYTAWETQALPLLEAGLRIAGALDARLMLPGNVYNFGADMPSVLSEDTPQRADTRKGRIRVAMERRLAHAARAGAVRSVVIRAGDFFGSGTGAWFDRVLVKDIQRGKMTYPGALDVPTAWAYLPDLANAFARVANRMQQPDAGVAPFDVFHFQGHTLAGAQWSRLLEGVAQEQRWLHEEDALRVAALPWNLIRWGGAVVPAWRELAEMQYLWRTSHRLDGSKLAALIGPEPRTVLSNAVCASLRSLGIVRDAPCGMRAWA